MRDALGGVQSVLLVGGTSEIGLAIVRTLVAGRARRVVLAARDAERARAAAGELGEGVAVETLPFDAAAPDAGAAFGPAFAAGDVDVAVVAAGLLDAPAADLQRVNGAGAVAAMDALAERMRAQGHGTIVLLSSIAAVRVRPSNYAYGASKAAADLHAQGLAGALAGTGVDVMIVRPGFVRTKMTEGMDEAPGAVDADAVAQAVADGLRDRRSVVYVPAPLRAVAAVLRVLPAPLLRRLPR